MSDKTETWKKPLHSGGEGVVITGEKNDMEKKKKLWNIITYIKQGAKVNIITKEKERKLTVVSENSPEWADIDSEKFCLTLEGYGTKYMLRINHMEGEWYPILTWPSSKGVEIIGVEIIEPAPAEKQIQSKKTAEDIFERI